MSDYLVNLARRSAGIAPVARPRSGPDPGLIARIPPGVEQPSSSSPMRSGSVGGASATEMPGDRQPPRVAPVLEPRPLRIIERVPAVEGVADALARQGSPSKPTPIETGPASPGQIRSAIADPPGSHHEPNPERHGPDAERRRGDVSVAHLPPGPADGPRPTAAPRMTIILPELSPAPLGRPGAVVEDRGPGRDVQVRIGTIEIHPEPATPAPTSVMSAPAPVAPVLAHGGFDEFVRLRSYAPWER